MTMRPRRPREENEWVRADCDAVQELAQAYAPTLAFSEEERFFPILAESWLSHSSYGQWPSDEPDGMSHLLPTDGANRGTALIETETDGDTLDVNRVAGAPNHAGRPLQLTTDTSDPHAIGRPDRRGEAGTDLSLVFGGWSEPDRTAGDEGYLASVFSEFAGAMNPTDAIEWDDPPRPTWPTMWVPQPPTPTVYAEVEWTGRFPDIDEAGDLGDFAPGADDRDNTRLDGYLQITYHYLFPMRRPGDTEAPEGEQVARSESQWQAATVVFETRRETHKELNEEGRPEGLQFREPPVAVVLSHQLDADTKAEVVGWEDDGLERFQLESADSEREYASTSPIVYVGRGTHSFFPEPVDGGNPYTDDGDEAESGAEDLGTDEFEDEGGVGGFLLALLVILAALLVLAALAVAAWALLAALSAVLAVAAIVVLAVLAILTIIAGLAWLEDWFDNDGKEPHRRSANEEATGDGSAGAPPPTETDGSRGPSGDQRDSGGHDDPSREGSVVDSGGYASGVGGPRGHNAASFDVRVVDRVNPHDETGFPPPPGNCERPTWWAFTGNWGAPVSVREDAGWTWGPQRVDEHGRSWSYWHAVVFDQYLSRE